MRTIEVELFKFDELSDEAKEKAIENYRNNPPEYGWHDENRATIEAFEKAFPVSITNWSYGGRGEGVDFHVTDDDVAELTGSRLMAYLYNNHQDNFLSRKYLQTRTIRQAGFDIYDADNKPMAHPMRKIKRINAGPNEGKYTTYHYSNLTFQEYGCPLTGYHMDNYIVDPIYKFLKGEGFDRTFEELMADCFAEWVKACREDMEAVYDDENIIDDLQNSDREFEADGTEY